MRIAIPAHVRHPIAPPFEGGMEAMTWHLARGLALRGHDVTLMASGDSVPPDGVRLEAITPEHYDRAFPWHDFHGTETLNDHLDAIFARACRLLLEGRFDVVHNNSLHRYPPRLAREARLPMVTSLHVPPFDALRRAVHDSAAPWNRSTVTSAVQRGSWWPGGAPATGHVLHNGIDLARWPYRPGGDGGAVWAGRITPTKGTHLAAEAARIAGVPLTIHGVIEHRDYFETEVRPLLGETVRYGGHLSGDDLAAAFGQASVLLFTPLWDEPFGLAAAEAMATGLPVAATDRGAVREVLGDAGVVAPAEAGALADAIRTALAIPPERPHARAVRMFGMDRMIDRCEALYAAARAGRDAPMPPSRFVPGDLAAILADGTVARTPLAAE